MTFLSFFRSEAVRVGIKAGVVWAYVLSFLALGKDADPDIPIPKQVKAEYSKLKIPILGLACARFARGRP